MDLPIQVGIIGCGNISPAYFKGCAVFDILQVTACADIDPARAQARAQEFGIPRACSVAELLADPQIQIAVNLTIPKVHAEVSLAASRAGKHVYSEKPLALNRQEGCQILDEAEARGLRVGCAPDTFLGGGIQTCRKLIDDGWIGEPVAATAFMTCHGHESWHPDPVFYYKPGGGPMFDMGPYYLTALVNLIGPVRGISGMVRTTFSERLITSQPLKGTRVAVEVPTHVAGLIDFENGAVGTIVTTFDVWAASLPRIEIYGSEGSLSVPDPNGFGGPVRVFRAGAKEWSDIPLTHSPEISRGAGVADMAYGLVYGRPHRASGALAYHVLDAMQSFGEASDAGQYVPLTSRCARPAALPLGLRLGELDR